MQVINTTEKDRDEYLRKLGLGRPEEVLPPDERKSSNRRQERLPTGFERRKGNRRKTRSSIGRERYLDMVLKERTLFSQQGFSRSTEQLLSASGAGSEAEVKAGERDSATGDQLRALLPVQTWLPLSIHLVGLEKGVLTVAPLHELTERQAQNLKNTTLRSGFKVEKIETQMWDRADLTKTLHAVHDLSADRCEKTLSNWLGDIDNGLLLNQFQRDLLAEALQMRASDIHLVQDNAPDAPNWIKYRIDGDLVPIHLLPAEAMARLTTLLKRDAGLNFGDRSTPKDGRFGFVWQGRSVDVRVAAGPQAQDGEKLTLRLLDRAGLKNFEELFSRYPEVAEHLARLLAPEIKGGGGLILMSGPTGSGKSTTLYACVLEIDRRRRHVLSIEDPIEYEMRYATQWQVAQIVGAGREFADLIRAAMRHDPDYIIIGEMRDTATVETALKAAESGHTVVSTIHADTAVQTLERLRSFMPSERERSSTYTLSQQIRGVLNQRLVKTLCHSCSIKMMAKEVLSPEEMENLELMPEDIVRNHNPSGCDLCNHAG
ncbi:MAG: Flp pilus assembly complex ATPase component TadA, partial [Alphaproteobacteria bacterium]|nr:Flp pilus assembly complex ATPase component TadA [Alphaproteobacteria bacterium]